MSQPFFKILSVISNLIYFLLNQSATITNCWAFRSSRKGSLGSELLIKLLNILLKIEFYNGSHLMDEKNFDCMKCNKEAKHTHTHRKIAAFFRSGRCRCSRIASKLSSLHSFIAIIGFSTS